MLSSVCGCRDRRGATGVEFSVELGVSRLQQIARKILVQLLDLDVDVVGQIAHLVASL